MKCQSSVDSFYKWDTLKWTAGLWLVKRCLDGQNFIVPSFTWMLVLQKKLKWSMLWPLESLNKRCNWMERIIFTLYICKYVLSLSIFSKEENLQAIEPSIVLSLQWIILQKQPDFHFHILNFYETIRYTNSLVNATFGSWKKLC